MLRIKQVKNKYQIFYKYYGHWNKDKTLLNQFCQYVDFSLNDLYALYLKHHAVIDDKGEFYFDSQEQAKQCYYDIVEMNKEGLTKLPRFFWETKEVKNNVFVINFSTINTIASRKKFTEVAKGCHISQKDLKEIYTKNQCFFIEEDLAIFENEKNAKDCIEEINDYLNAKSVLKKMTKGK